MKKFTSLIIIFSFVFCTFVLSGCGGALQSENETWRVRVLSINKSNERIIDKDGSYMNPHPGAEFLIIKVKVDSKGSVQSLSPRDVTLIDKDGNVYDPAAMNTGQGFVVPDQNIMQVAIGEWDEDVEFLFGVPKGIELEIFQFQELPPITISDLTGN